MGEILDWWCACGASGHGGESAGEHQATCNEIFSCDMVYQPAPIPDGYELVNLLEVPDGITPPIGTGYWSYCSVCGYITPRYEGNMEPDDDIENHWTSVHPDRNPSPWVVFYNR